METDMNQQLIERLKAEALEEHIPIMEDEGLECVCRYLQDHEVNSLLEIGTAIGYSALVFARCRPGIRIVTLEKDEERYKRAVANIEAAGCANITAVLTDARSYQLDEQFDVLFIDGPKAHNGELLERYLGNLKADGTVIVDDVRFHGLIDDPEAVVSRRLRPLVRKIGEFRERMLADPRFESEYLPSGDGVLICRRRKEYE